MNVVIGSDGGRSWTRKQLGIEMIGDSTNYVWGVVDLRPVSNFPGIRARCAIHSQSGSLMVIPRERGIVRLYIQLESTLLDGERFDRGSVTPHAILTTARRILSPYTLETDSIEWFTAYVVGQRRAETFAFQNSVFLVGDSAHVHSPKAGQGMNVGLQDSFNLATKLGLVCAGIGRKEILETYATEREVVAKHLIEFDAKFSKLFSGRPIVGDEVEGVDVKEFANVMRQGALENAGFLIDYSQSILSNKADSKQRLATKLPVGTRLFDSQIIHLASGNSVWILDALRFTGACRLLLFPGNIEEPKLMNRVKDLATYLDSPRSIISLYTPSHVKRSSVIQVITIHSSPRESVDLFEFAQPSIFYPSDYDTLFVDGESYLRGHGKAYEKYGITKDRGALIVLRPDNYVAMICDLEDTHLLDSFFSGIFIQAKNGSPASTVRLLPPVVWKEEEKESFGHLGDDSGIELTGLI